VRARIYNPRIIIQILRKIADIAKFRKRGGHSNAVLYSMYRTTYNSGKNMVHVSKLGVNIMKMANCELTNSLAQELMIHVNSIKITTQNPNVASKKRPLNNTYYANLFIFYLPNNG
jgi:hypothetical protein